MTNMRAKMRVASVEKQGKCEYVQEVLTFSAVAKSGNYDEKGSDENNTYAKFSPQGEVKLTVANSDLHGKFEVGQLYYVDFTPA